MDPNKMCAKPCYSSNSNTGQETGAPRGTELDPRRTVNECGRCHNHGITGQIKDQEHVCFFETCQCHKCTFFSEGHQVWTTENGLKMEQDKYLKGHLSQRRRKHGSAPLQTHKRVKKSGVKAEVSGKLPRGSVDHSFPRIFVSALDSSTLEDATNNFTFQEGPQAPCTAYHDLKVSEQDSASLEWQRKLEAAEALLSLRSSFQGPSDSISVHQSSTASVSAGDREFQAASPCLRPRSTNAVSLPIGHLGCISLLS